MQRPSRPAPWLCAALALLFAGVSLSYVVIGTRAGGFTRWAAVASFGVLAGYWVWRCRAAIAARSTP